MLMMPHQRIPHVLAPPRPPQVAARFKDTPHPRELLALGARVEETPLRVGKWRGKGAKTLRYVLSLPEEQAVEYRGRLLQELTLKVAPSGKGEVERTAEHQGASYATLIQASIGFWQGDPALVAELEQVFPLLVRKETPIKQLYAFNDLYRAAAFLKHRADLFPVALALGAPIYLSPRLYGAFEPFLDPGCSWQGTLERVRQGRTRRELDEAHVLFQGGAVRVSLEEGWTEGDYTHPLREVLEGLPPNPRHPERGCFRHARLLEQVAALRAAYGEGRDKLPHLEALAQEGSLEHLLRAIQSYRADPNDWRHQLLWEALLNEALQRLWQAETAGPTLQLFPQHTRLKAQAARACHLFNSLAAAMEVDSTGLAELLRLLHNRPTGAFGYLGPVLFGRNHHA